MDIFLWLIGLILLLLVYMIWIEPNRLVIRKVKLAGPLKKQLRIVHFTDTHFRQRFSIKKMERLIANINDAQADVIIFSGDLMENYEMATELSQTLPPYLKRLKARLAKIAVYGNHDIGGGAKDVYPQIMKEADFHLLCNEVLSWENEDLAVFGMDDWIAGYEDRTLPEQKLRPYQLLVVHEPDLIDELDMRDIDLMISGHTHGGQIYLPFVTPFILPKGGKRHRKGLYHHGQTTLYVSAGLGMRALPMRLGNPPEIVIYEIEPFK